MHERRLHPHTHFRCIYTSKVGQKLTEWLISHSSIFSIWDQHKAECSFNVLLKSELVEGGRGNQVCEVVLKIQTRKLQNLQPHRITAQCFTTGIYLALTEKSPCQQAYRQKSYQRTLFEPQWTKMWPQGISVEVQHCVSVCCGKVGLFCRTNKRFLLQEVYFHDIVPEMRLCLSLFS